MNLLGFGDRLKLLRKSFKMSQGVFAKKLGISTRTLAGWEAEESFPPENKLHFLAKTLEVNLAWLVDGSGEKLAPQQEPKIDNQIISNSIELRIRKRMEAEFNNFQHEIIFLYDSLEDFEENKELPLLIAHLEQAKIPISNLIKHAITEKDRKSALDFINTLSDIEKLYILQNISLFRRMLWDSMAWSNRILHKSPA